MNAKHSRLPRLLGTAYVLKAGIQKYYDFEGLMGKKSTHVLFRSIWQLAEIQKVRGYSYSAKTDHSCSFEYSFIVLGTNQQQ